MFGMVAIPLSVPIIIAGGAALYLLLMMAFGGAITYKQSLAVWTYSSLTTFGVGAFIAILVLFLKSPDSIDPEHMVATNPACSARRGRVEGTGGRFEPV